MNEQPLRDEGTHVPILDKISNLGEGRKLKQLRRARQAHEHLRARGRRPVRRGARGQRPIEFRERLANGEPLDDLLPEAFAVTREAARRTIGQRHFDVQLMGGAALHLGNIAEMKTGEGKTLVSTLPGYLNAAGGRGRPHRHRQRLPRQARLASGWAGSTDSSGSRSGLIQADMTPEQRRPAYGADVTYGTNNEFGFDYLRDNMAMQLDQCVQRGYRFAIVDEVDSILIDEARTPLIISGMVSDSREVVPDVRARRAAAHEGRRLRGRRVEVPGRGDGVGRREGRGDPPARQPLRQREHDARASPAQRASREGAVQARRRLRREPAAR